MRPPESPIDPGPAADLPTVDLMGFAMHAVREAECVDHIIDRARRGQGGWVVTPNLDHLRRLVGQPDFRALCSRATLRVVDGMPLVWASRIRGTPLPERVAGSDLIVSLTAAAARAGVSVYLLGGSPGTAAGAAQVLARRCPGLLVAGTHCPEPGFESDAGRLQAIERTLRERAPGIVYVGLGSPKQEVVIDRLRPVLPSAWWLGIGVSFSFLTGDVRRAPRWLQAIGLEWLHRLAQERRRLARRYLVQGLPFAARLLLGSACRRLVGPRTG
jgi:N-acetylglucosaminyldiphosphoundecaprenol N-acetyl-beta-D-mannosaminyltransferase